MPLVHKRLKAVVTTGAAAALCAGAVAAASPSQATPRSAIPDTRPSWASASARVSAAAVTTGTVNARVYLAGQNPAGLAAYATAVSTPSSADYGHYLSAAQVKAEFGPTNAQIAAVKAWLTGDGLTVTSVNDSVDGYVAVSGSVSDAATAFNVTFQNFRGPDKRTDRAPAETASAPASVASAVLTVVRPGHRHPPDEARLTRCRRRDRTTGSRRPVRRTTGRRSRPASRPPTARSSPGPTAGTPRAQVRGAYGVSQSGMTGQGQTVAIVDAYASPTMRSDANEFAKVVGDKPFRPGQYQQYLPSTFTDTAADECDAPSWYGEETLDVQQVHGEAPDANVHYVAAASCTDPDLLSAAGLHRG